MIDFVFPTFVTLVIFVLFVICDRFLVISVVQDMEARLRSE